MILNVKIWWSSKKALPLLKKAAKMDPDPEIKEHIRIVEDVRKRHPMIR
jgi:hypothetical protein